MLPLRLLAIGSGVTGVLYCWFYLGDWVTSIWEFLFVLVNFVQVAYLMVEQFRISNTPDEERLRQTVFSDMDNHEFAALMRVAQWHNMPLGTKLTEEGSPVERLMLLIAGAVQVEIRGVGVAVCRDNDFVGELSFLSNAVASATTTATNAGRFLSFEIHALQSLVTHEPGLERMMQRLLNVNLVEKLREKSLNSM